MYLWGAIAFLQITFLPGFILCYLLGIRRLIPILVYAFALSHLVNFIGVWLLSALALYTREALIASIFIECIIIIYLLRSVWRTEVTEYLSRELQDWQNFFQRYANERFVIFFLMLALVCFALTLGELYKNKDNIFTMWDAVVSWNEWAIQWAHGSVPAGTGQYPQLLPINWSIAYVLMQDHSVQFFNKASVSLFFCYTLLILLDDGIRKQQVRSIFGVIFAYYLISHILKSFAVSGLADLPVAFFSFLSILYLLQLYESPTLKKNMHQFNASLLTAALLCAAAMNTKQAALFTLLIFTALIFLIIKKRYTHSYWQMGRQFLVLLGIILALGLPWHIKKRIDIQKQKDTSNIEYVTQGIHGNRNYWQRNYRALASIDGHLGPAAKYILPILLVAALWRHATALILLFHMLPFLFLWTTFYSYDERNLALALPPTALLLGQGLEVWRNLINKYFSNTKRVQPFRIAYVLFAFLIIVLGANSRIKSSYLREQQLTKQRLSGDTQINYELYSYFAQADVEKGLIITNYMPLVGVPELEVIAIRLPHIIFSPYHLRVYKAKYVLVYLNAELEQQVLRHGCKLVLQGKYYKLYKIPATI